MVEPSRLAEQHLYGFLTALRAAGIGAVPPKQADFLRAVAGSPPRDVTALYWRARVTLLTGIGDVPAFDGVFDAWFRSGPTPGAVAPPAEDSDVAAPNPRGDADLPPQDTAAGSGVEASDLPTSGRRAFGAATPGERDQLRTLDAAWRACRPSTPSRRHRPARSGRRLDMRHIWRQARRNGGEIAELRWLVRPYRARRLLLLVDVSGSVKQHTPQLLRLAHAALHSAPGRTEVFTFGTRLTRVTAALSTPDPDRALRALSDEALDIDGGTAIGAALGQFLDNPRFLALARGALVIIVSDGLERGDCTPMARGTARLSRLGYRLVWWSPLACSPTYRPATRGMSAQLGNLDHLGGVRDLRSGQDEIRRLPAVLAGPRRAVGRRWPDLLPRREAR